MSLPAENRLQLGMDQNLIKEFLVIKHLARSIEKNRRGFYSRVAFNNEALRIGLKGLKKKYKLQLTPEEIEAQYKKIRRSQAARVK